MTVFDALSLPVVAADFFILFYCFYFIQGLGSDAAVFLFVCLFACLLPFPSFELQTHNILDGKSLDG